MNLVILHHHLHRGGVTQVIINHLLALDRQLSGEQWRAAILFSGRYDAWLEQFTHLQSIKVTLCHIPALDYDASDNVTPQPKNLGDQVARQLEELDFKPGETVIHSHNHSLAKNTSLPGALICLAERGYHLLLQIHDFAEDYRPADFRRLVVAAKAAEAEGRSDTSAAPRDLPPESDTAMCYPQAPHIHYAVLNRRDDAALAAAGISGDQRHLLPNPVAEPSQWSSRQTARRRLEQLFDVSPHDRYVLYPVRCIRRKNIGEAVLWSAMAPRRTTFGFTLPPENPRFVPVYDAWKRLANRLRLPCRFEVGGEGALRFVENRAAADMILTTSLVEGFGMVFLETWLAGLMLSGRDLPEITADFAQSGLVLDVFDSLRPQLEIPSDWVGADQFRRLLEDGYNHLLNQYGAIPRSDHQTLARRIEQRLDEGRVDFGELDEGLQHRIIDKVADDSTTRMQVERLNPWIPRALRRHDQEKPWTSDIVNQRTVALVRNTVATMHAYGFEPIGQRLRRLYSQVVASERTDRVLPLAEPGRIIDQFLDARRYRPIATC